MSKQQRSDSLDEAISTVVDEVLDGRWSHATIETLMRRAAELSGLSEGLFFRSTPETGDLHDATLHERMPKRVSDARLRIELPPTAQHPNGRLIMVSAIHYVPTGEQLDQKWANDADTHGKPGVWVRVCDLQLEGALWALIFEEDAQCAVCKQIEDDIRYLDFLNWAYPTGAGSAEAAQEWADELPL